MVLGLSTGERASTAGGHHIDYMFETSLERPSHDGTWCAWSPSSCNRNLDRKQHRYRGSIAPWSFFRLSSLDTRERVSAAGSRRPRYHPQIQARNLLVLPGSVWSRVFMYDYKQPYQGTRDATMVFCFARMATRGLRRRLLAGSLTFILCCRVQVPLLACAVRHQESQ